MHHVRARAPFPSAVSIVVLLLVTLLGACEREGTPLAPRAQTWAELRVVRRDVKVMPPGGGGPRAVPARAARGRRDGDGGAGGRGVDPARRGRDVPRARAREADVEAGDAGGGGGEAVRRHAGAEGRGDRHAQRAGAALAGAGEHRRRGRRGDVGVRARGRGARGERGARAEGGSCSRCRGKGADLKAKAEPVVAWDDWTGGLATTDRAAEPAPYGVGTVGARARERGRAAVPARDRAARRARDDRRRLRVDRGRSGVLQPLGADGGGHLPVPHARGRVARALRRGPRRRDRVGAREGEAGGRGAVPGRTCTRAARKTRPCSSGTRPGTYNARLYPIEPGARRGASSRGTRSGWGARARRGSGGSTCTRWPPRAPRGRCPASRS